MVDIWAVRPTRSLKKGQNSAIIWRGSVLPRVLPRVALYSVLAVVVVLTHMYTGSPIRFESFTLPPDVVLGLMLIFRTNTAYDRF